MHEDRARVLCHVLREKAPVRAWREGGTRARTPPGEKDVHTSIVSSEGGGTLYIPFGKKIKALPTIVAASLAGALWTVYR